jgi:hypothetical protein
MANSGLLRQESRDLSVSRKLEQGRSVRKRAAGILEAHPAKSGAECGTHSLGTIDKKAKSGSATRPNDDGCVFIHREIGAQKIIGIIARYVND